MAEGQAADREYVVFQEKDATAVTDGALLEGVLVPLAKVAASTAEAAIESWCDANREQAESGELTLRAISVRNLGREFRPRPQTRFVFD